MGAQDGNLRTPLIKRLGRFAAILFLILIVIGVLFTIISPFFGWRSEVVISGSMEPGLATGSIVVVQPVATENIHTGDIIMYYSPDKTSLTTHRVVRVESEPDLRFITKGDANKNPDILPVESGHVVGNVAFNLPYLGYFIQFVKTPLGFILFFLIPAVILIGSEMLHIWGEME